MKTIETIRNKNNIKSNFYLIIIVFIVGLIMFIGIAIISDINNNEFSKSILSLETRLDNLEQEPIVTVVESSNVSNNPYELTTITLIKYDYNDYWEVLDD